VLEIVVTESIELAAVSSWYFVRKYLLIIMLF